MSQGPPAEEIPAARAGGDSPYQFGPSVSLSRGPSVLWTARYWGSPLHGSGIVATVSATGRLIDMGGVVTCDASRDPGGVVFALGGTIEAGGNSRC